MISFFIILLFGFPLSSWAADSPEETLPPNVVTATRVETPVSQVATSLTVITEKEIRERQAETVLEVLRDVPGFDVVERGSRGAQTTISIRGSNSEQVLVMIDGVEVNSVTQGFFDFAHLTTENVERIEVLRGSGGTLYGSQAVGGVVHVITKRGEGPPRLTFSAEGGNGRTHRQVLGLTGSLDRLGYSLTLARLETDGFRKFNDDYLNLNTSGRLDYRLTDDASLKGIFRFLQTDQGLFNSNNFIPGSPGDPNAREDLSQYLGKLEWEQRVVKGWDYRISGSFFKEHDKFSDDPEAAEPCTSFHPVTFACIARSQSLFRPQIGTAEFQTNYQLGEWSTTTFGVEFKRRKASTSNIGDGEDLGGINRAIRNLGYYVQQQIQLFDARLLLTSGIRFDDHQSFGSEWSPSFSAAYLFKASRTKIKTGYAEGFRAPTLNELFFPAGFGCAAFGNPDLGPERSWELNAGVEQAIFGDRVRLEGTYFHREVEDLVGTGSTPDPSDPGFCVRAENVGRAGFDGVEWLIHVKVFRALSIGANYTYLDWNTENGRLPRRPNHRGNLSLSYDDRGVHINFAAHIVSKRQDTDTVTAADIIKPGYARFDLAGSYLLPLKMPLLKSVTAFGKVENLFNKKYEEADGFRARPLNFLLGLRGTFGGNTSNP